jgi:hypothetical protein
MTVDLKAARVTFKDGFEITHVRLGNDCSTIELVNLPDELKPQMVTELLAMVNVNVHESAVLLKHGAPFSKATIKFEDPNSAKLAAQMWRECYDDASYIHGGMKGAISTSAIYTTSKYTAHLDLCRIDCLWYRPSRKAVIFLDDLEQARNVMLHIQQSPDLLGREIVVTGTTGSERRPALKLEQLHPNTREEHVLELVRSVTTNPRIEMRAPTCRLKDEDAAWCVRELLRESGGLQTFSSVQSSHSSRNLKATAGFIDRPSAMRAVHLLNNKNFEAIGNVKLMLTRSLRISYHIPTAISNAVQPQLDKIYREAQAAFGAGTTVNITKGDFVTIIRCRTASERFIVQYNAAIEKLLAGDVLLDGESPLWHPWFASSRGMTAVNKIAASKHVYIYRDLHRCHLRLYGGNTSTSKALIVQLLGAVESATRRIHTITLNEEMVLHATNGGLERLREKFRNTVLFNHTGGLAGFPAIFLYGTKADAQVASSLIVKEPSPIPQESELDDCPVCLGAPMDPVKLSCGHAYCRDCFYDASVAMVEHVPFTCLGAEGECDHVCGIKEVAEILPFERYEKLFEEIFTTYIRRHPEELRCCPAPDCTSIYRPTKDGLIFTCIKCLAPICTSCHVLEHKGITCADYQRYHADGGLRALAQYKADNDVRDCPKCSVSIEKNDGCMHMQCRSCFAHICWFCMDYFDQGDNGGHHDCYMHMVIQHGGIYNPEDPDYAQEPHLTDDEEEEGEGEGAREGEGEGEGEGEREEEREHEREREHEDVAENGFFDVWGGMFGDENEVPQLEDLLNEFEGGGRMDDEDEDLAGAI